MNQANSVATPATIEEVFAQLEEIKAQIAQKSVELDALEARLNFPAKTLAFDNTPVYSTTKGLQKREIVFLIPIFSPLIGFIPNRYKVISIYRKSVPTWILGGYEIGKAVELEKGDVKKEVGYKIKESPIYGKLKQDAEEFIKIGAWQWR